MRRLRTSFSRQVAGDVGVSNLEKVASLPVQAGEQGEGSGASAACFICPVICTNEVTWVVSSAASRYDEQSSASSPSRWAPQAEENKKRQT